MSRILINKKCNTFEMPILKMINCDVCDFNENVAFRFMQDFESCKLLSFGHDSYFQRNVAGLLLTEC